MKAKIVVGLGFGDEGKGITTDYLTSKLPDSIVVRYTGGHQASHTVYKDGVQHIFSSYASGALRGAESYISEHCLFYPPYLIREAGILETKLNGKTPKLIIHPLAKLTTPYDLAFNRLREYRLGHGSVGVGIGTTMSRQNGPYKLHAVDLLYPMVLKEKLEQIRKYYESELYNYNVKERKYYSDTVELEFKFYHPSIDAMDFQIASYDYLTRFKHIIFEGAQGILLDMDLGIFPNVTYGHTSSKNAIAICRELGIRDIELYYVTRSYLTRHGNGWMPNQQEITLINNEHEINVPNEWQGSLRVGELDYDLLNYALKSDSAYSCGHDKNLVITCLDQRPDFKLSSVFDYEQFVRVIGSYSPDSKDFKVIL